MNEVIQRLRRAGYTVRNRRDWGSTELSTYAERRRSKPVDFPVDHIFAHITVTSTNGDAGARQVEQIGSDRFGSGMSYQWLVDHETHAIYEGQPMDAKGTHTVNDKRVARYGYDLNYAGHAVAWMAMPGDTFCGDCAELFAAIQAAERLEGILRDAAVYLPHSMFAAKDCPTDVLRDMLPVINRQADRMVAQGFVDRPTRVSRFNDQLEDALELLDDVPERRKRVHKVKAALEAIADRLPER